jgi:hypothetical protein
VNAIRLNVVVPVGFEETAVPIPGPETRTARLPMIANGHTLKPLVDCLSARWRGSLCSTVFDEDVKIGNDERIDEEEQIGNNQRIDDEQKVTINHGKIP